MNKMQYLKDYKPSLWKIPFIKLDFLIRTKNVAVTSKFEIQKKDKSVTKIDLDGINLQLISLKVDGKKASAKNYKVDEDGLHIFGLKKKKHQLTIKHTTSVYQKTEPMGLYSFNGIICSQCEPEGFRRITYFIDKPEIQSKFQCKIRASKKKYPHLLSNGKLIQKKTTKDTHWVLWEDSIPKSCYLFALVAGKFYQQNAEYKSKKKKTTKIEMFVPQKYKDYCDYALSSLKNAMHFDEEVYKLEYDLDVYRIVGVENFNLGAMENKGLNIFNMLCILTSPEITTDEEYIEIDNIIAHEYFHNWTGNRVGIQNWFNLALKEGLTVFRDQEYSAYHFSKTFQRIKDVRKLKIQQMEENKGQLAHPVLLESYLNADNSYSPSVYLKGAEIFRMLISVVGKISFNSGFQKFIKEYDQKTATLDQFIACMEKTNNKKLDQFKRWYTKVEIPQIKVLEHYNFEQETYTLIFLQIDSQAVQKNKKYDWNIFLKPLNSRNFAKPAIKEDDNITAYQLQQFPLAKEPVHIPLEIAFLDKNSSEMLFVDLLKNKQVKLLQLKKSYQRFSFYNITQKPLPSFNRNFTAPVEIDFPYSGNELSVIANAETNVYLRWEASNKIFTKTVCEQIERYLEDKVLFLSDELVINFQKNITSSVLELPFIYHILQLPQEKELLIRLKLKNPDAIHFVRNYIVTALAQNLESNFISLYEQNEPQFQFSLEKAEMFKRMIFNTSLYYIARTDTGLHFVCKHYQTSKCFSNTMGALKAINDLDCRQREESFKDSFKKWKTNEILLCKWFSLQATSSRLKTLDKMEELLGSNFFSLRKTNLVHALLVSFAFNNPYCFHHISGRGYSLITKYIIKLDELNPPVASRLASAFSQSGSFSSIRQEKIQASLEQILAKKKLSSNLSEVTQKIFKNNGR